VALGVRDGSVDVGLTTVAVRAILAPFDEPAGRADLVAQRLGQAIRLGLVLDQEQLPPEAKLAEQLGVSTVTLREALAALREQGLVVTRRGRGGGTFVRAPADPAQGLVQRLRQFTTQELRDLGDHRSAVSGMAARLAAGRALPEEIQSLARQVDRLRAAGTMSERRRADTQFNIEVAAAAQSPRLTREELRLRAEVGDLLWLQLDEEDHEASVQVRSRLVDAIERGDAGLARDLAELHVAADTARLLQLRLRIYDLGREAT
jgi:GntR family transcriptional regulator, transcriptional repressor for pyruvate dehydrogenase complex